MSSGGFEPTVTLEKLRAGMQSFADERDWAQFHTPRNLLIAMTGEVGELSELFMWKHDAGAAPGLPSWTAAEKQHLGEELSDVLLYLIRLSDRCGIDLPSAAIAKMAKNAKKYPADVARGSSAKYTAYEGAAGGAAAADATSTVEATAVEASHAVVCTPAPSASLPEKPKNSADKACPRCESRLYAFILGGGAILAITGIVGMALYRGPPR